MRYAVTRCYVEDFGRTRMAICERQVGPRKIRTATEILMGEATEDTWKRLQAVVESAEELVEAS
jgi:hypothetical protein